MALRYLNVFCKVYKKRSFSQAAEELLLTQPTVSSHIKALEDDLQLKLFDRLSREVAPTKAGDILYAYAKDIEGLKRSAEQALARYSGEMRGTLDMGGSTIPGEFLLPSLIGKFKSKYPEVRANLRIGDTKVIAEMVMNGKIELGLVGASVDDDRIESSILTTDELVLIAPSSYRAGKISVEEFKTIPLIFRENGSGSRRALEEGIKKSGFTSADLNIVAEMGSTEAVKRAVKSGVGLSIVSSLSIEDELKMASLKVIKMKGLPIVRNLYIISHRLRNKSPLCQAFLEFVSSQA